MSEHESAFARNAEATDRLRALVSRLDGADLERSLGGGWTVAVALAHLAFWDARQVVALQRYRRGEGFPSEDFATNATLEAIAPLFRPDRVGPGAVEAAEQLDELLQSLSREQLRSLSEAGLGYAIDRWQHRLEHLEQIEAVLP